MLQDLGDLRLSLLFHWGRDFRSGHGVAMSQCRKYAVTACARREQQARLAEIGGCGGRQVAVLLLADSLLEPP